MSTARKSRNVNTENEKETIMPCNTTTARGPFAKLLAVSCAASYKETERKDSRHVLLLMYCCSWAKKSPFWCAKITNAKKRAVEISVFFFPLLAVDAGNKSVANKNGPSADNVGEFSVGAKVFPPVIVLYEDTTQRYLAIVNNCPGFMTSGTEKRRGNCTPKKYGGQDWMNL